MSKTFRKDTTENTKQSKQTNVKQQRKAKQQYKWLSAERSE
jgi:hypothetical protein